MKKAQTLFLLAIAFLALTACNTSDQRPNIILINVDDMGWKDLSVMGSTYYDTPNIDSLIRSGMLFTDAYAAAANCAPSRASMMTGKWSTRHGVYTVGSSARGKSKNRQLIPIKNTVQPDTSFYLLPEVLQDNGYLTCHAGKWHLSDDPLADGFAVNIGGGPNGHPGSYYPPYKNVSVPAGKNEHLTDLIMEKTIEFVQSADGPFFLHYAPYAVHTPIQAIEELVPKYENRPASGGQNNVAYATMIENLDRNIGLLLQAVSSAGKDDNLLIVFTSDNGGLYGITEQHPLRAGKGAYYEGGIRVPTAFIWPGHIPAGERNATPISNLDLFPTLLSVSGIEYQQDNYDGNSLWPLPTTGAAMADRSLFWHFPVYLQAYKKKNAQNRDPLFRTRPGSVVRQGDWKLHYYFEDEKVELFNLTTDIGEVDNLAERQPEKAAEMLGLLHNWWEQTEAPIPSEPNPEFGQSDTD
ncbi:MAG: arylsulfatase A-like enzyme [Neolewinella sp.]|jgi:arylsulfatase A-like enzyme